MEILVVEPNEGLLAAIRTRLAEEDFAPVCVTTGTEALSLLDSLRFESILLDWALPDMDGIDVLRELRTRRLDTPVMILSSRGCVSDRVLALDSGADDYLLKPFHMDECMARVRRMVRTYRRHVPTDSGMHCIADLTVDAERHVVTRGGKRLPLSANECAVLEYLAAHAGTAMTHNEIERDVLHTAGSSAVIPVYIHNLRRKIDEGRAVPLLHTIRGKGYLLSPEPVRRRRRRGMLLAAAL